ncbi:AIR synthase related protein [Methanocaldococcus fervens]|uniref:AIR synthase related protein domain protein n=1 Tax=Methanocaldococcus fervens (strain DSM 4213 / JCM 15782 / AG86) TaxID=573064 RepID=C7P8D7_METFA|nr:AIR synthase related protein [Methanocaldococcus fervens]ACV24819.1 AIR synthase related protein domain protein [Methanocaldococcus fervens AG86]
MENFEYELNMAINHILETNYPRKAFWHFDDLIDDLKSGIKAGDDAVVIKDMVINMEGPYPLKLGAKTALIHTTCDVVAMGAKPKFALNVIQAKNEDEIKLAVDGLRRQSIGLGIPIIGGNTQTVEELKSCISVAVFGELIDENLIIRDGGAKEGDLLIMLGDPVEGDIGERVYKAKKKFDTYLEILENGIKVNACKDASRGGWLGNLLEMLIKAKKGAEIKSLPHPRATRYLGTYIIALPEEEYDKVLDIALKNKCPLVLFGRILEKPKLIVGTKEYISENKMLELIKKFPYKY